MHGGEGHGGDRRPGPDWLESIRCSFCGKRGTEVGKIIAGPTPAVAICNECVDLCAEMIAEEGGAPGPPPDSAA
jgi:hypothetical protein